MSHILINVEIKLDNHVKNKSKFKQQNIGFVAFQSIEYIFVGP